MVEWLQLTTADRVLDIGCGRGDHVAQFVRHAGRVVGADISQSALAVARREMQGVAGTAALEWHRADVNALPFSPGAFTLAWASHLLHFQPDPVASAREMARVVAPGGRVAVRENYSLRVILPRDTGVGHPGLESRLNAAFDAWFHEDRLRRGRVVGGWRAILERAGLIDVSVKSFLHEREAPFSAGDRLCLHQMLARRDSPRLDPDDRQALARLVDPKGPDFFLDRLDVHFISVSTVFVGHVAR
jgi:SAM-dependent methyltransferase